MNSRQGGGSKEPGCSPAQLPAARELSGAKVVTSSGVAAAAPRTARPIRFTPRPSSNSNSNRAPTNASGW